MTPVPELEIAARLRAFREAVKMSQSDMAKRLELSVQSYSRYERGEREAPSTIFPLLVNLGASPSWLVTGQGEMLQSSDAVAAANTFSGAVGDRPTRQGFDAKSYVLIPRYDVRAAAGGGSLAEQQDAEGSVAFRREWLHRALRANPADLLVIEAAGDSMTGVVDDGDILLVDKSEPKLRGSGTYVFVVEDMLLVKHLTIRLDGALEINGSEAKAEPQVLSRRELEKVNIVGRVVWRAGRA